MNTAHSHSEEKLSAEELLAERQRLEDLYRDKYTREISVMFTDLKGSTALTETHGDLATRELVKVQNKLLGPIIEHNNGVLVKTMGDGTMSYFESGIDAIRTAVAFQKAVANRNERAGDQLPLEVRVGIHTGVGIVEEDDIFGDVVNVASRYESIAEAGEIYISDITFNNIEDKDEFYIRFDKEACVKGKKECLTVYKVFWDEEEIKRDADIEHPLPSSHQKAATRSTISPAGIARLLLAVVVMVGSVFLLMKLMEQTPSEEMIIEIRTKQDVASPAPNP
jgi:class 3 adenylate cyclase